MTTDTSEKGLESLIVADMLAAGWLAGNPLDYDREYAVDLRQLQAFLEETQPAPAEALDLGNDGPTRRQFLARLQGEIAKRGVIDVLRHGIKHGPHHLDLYYVAPTTGNIKPGFPIWSPSTCPNAVGILAKTRISIFTRRIPHDPTAHS